MLNINNSLNLLGLESGSTFEEVKKAYRKAAAKYHPDRNPAGQEMMKLINSAYEALQNFFKENPNSDSVEFYGDDQSYDYGEAINKALNAILNLTGINIEVCGAWVWVSGNTKEYKDVLKEAGYKWAVKKKMWYFRPESKKRRSFGKTYTMDQIRENYGSKTLKKGYRKEINY